MYHTKLSRCLSVALSIFGLNNCLYAADLKGWGSIETVPVSYFNISTQNILRCGSLCQKQGKCSAATFDKRERQCYMHLTHDIAALAISEANTNGRYLTKKYTGNPRKHSAESTCNNETQIVVPSARYSNGTCYNIKEGISGTTEASTAAVTTTTSTTPSTTTTVIVTEGTSENTAVTTAEVTTTTSTTPVTTMTVNRAAVCTVGGYTFFPTRKLCVRHYSETVNQQTNKAKCQADGGHLLLIKDEEMHGIIQEWLTSIGSNSVFIDGENPGLNWSFFTWKDELLPYIDWKAGNPDNEGCMKLSASTGFLFADEECSPGRGSVCEKDIP